MQCVTGSQCRVSRIGWMLSDFLAYTQALLLHSELFEVCLVSTEGNLEVKSYRNLSGRGQGSIQGLLEWWEGVVWNLYAWFVCMRLYTCCLCAEACWESSPGLHRGSLQTTRMGHRRLRCEWQTAKNCGQTFYLKVWSWLQFCCHLVEVCLRSSKTWQL